MTLKNELQFAINLAESTSKILLKFEKKINQLVITHKKSQGVASSADLSAENHIIKAIRKNYPEHSILAEETSYSQGVSDYESFCQYPYTWIIDPLDGTNNFLNGLNYYCVCICLAHYGKPVMGVVMRPSTGELFYAIKGKGAFYRAPGKKSKKIYSKINSKKLRNSIVSTGFATEKGQKIAEEFEPFHRLLTNARAIRRMGSAALDMCYTALGIFDGFWERHLAPWDVAASGIICEEAGAKVTDFDGRLFTPFDRTIIASREPLHRQIKNFIAKD